MAESKRSSVISAASESAPVARSQRLTGTQLQGARAAARERYAAIAEALKLEAGVTRHFQHKEISGLAWMDAGRILAPAGVTRRQLYVLAHECGHVVLHSGPHAWSKPGHVKEHEAETYAHRALARYGVEVPEKSARGARAYVGQWIMKDRAAGLPICPEAAAFASGIRSPDAPLGSVDGKPENDFSRHLEKFIAKGTKTVARLEQVEPLQQAPQQSSAAVAEFSRHERAQLKLLLKRGHRLARRRVPGVHAATATTLEQLERRVAAGQSALPAILRGLDALQELDESTRRHRRHRFYHELTSDEALPMALMALVAAVGCFLAGWAFDMSTLHYVGGFFVALALVAVAPTIVRLVLVN